ncbi:extracellular solute-binding protein, partial [Nostoc sp. NIES-2111]
LGGEAWQETILFNFVLVATGGKELFDAVYVRHDADTVRGPRFREAVAEFLRLKAYVDPGSVGRSWNDTTALVINGKAGVQVMGDWAKGEFKKAGLSAPRDFQCQIGIRPGGPLVFTGDLFVMIRTGGAEASATQELLARTMFSPDVQVAFNAVKGSIPVRTDADGSGFDGCA